MIRNKWACGVKRPFSNAAQKTSMSLEREIKIDRIIQVIRVITVITDIKAIRVIRVIRVTRVRVTKISKELGYLNPEDLGMDARRL